MMLSFDKAISKVFPSITRATVPTMSAAIAVIGISIARQQTRTVVLVRLRFKVGSNPIFSDVRGGGVESNPILRVGPPKPSQSAFSIGGGAYHRRFRCHMLQCIAVYCIGGQYATDIAVRATREKSEGVTGVEVSGRSLIPRASETFVRGADAFDSSAPSVTR